jgi:hypothetical protein
MQPLDGSRRGRNPEGTQKLTPFHSFTSSAHSRKDSGIVIASALAALRFTTAPLLKRCTDQLDLLPSDV